MTLEIEPPPGILLRPARPGDYAFALQLYLETIGPLLKALGTWDETVAARRFDNEFRRHPSQVICVGSSDAGWLQISRDDSSIYLDQVHLAEGYRNRGIGSSLVRAVMTLAERLQLPVVLNVIRGNPAIALYLRLGFRVVNEDQELLRMRWDPPPPEPA